MPTGTIVSLTLFIDGLLAGMFLCSAMVEHAARILDGPAWIAYKHAKETVFGAVMPPFFGLGLLTTLAAAILSPAHAPPGIAMALLLAAQVVTMRIHLPLNRLFQGWSPDALPADWARGRTRWQAWNRVRCVFAVAAFGVLVAAG